MSVDVDVIVLTWNDFDLARQAVASALQGQEAPLRVLLWDNGSEVAATYDHPQVEVVRSDRNLGVAGGRNAAAGRGSAPLILFLDSDASLEPGALDALIAPLLGDERVGMTAPVYVDQSPWESGGRAPSALRKVARGVGLTRRYAPVPVPAAGDRWDVEFAIGACQLVRRAAFDDVDGMSEDYRYGLEDLEFCARLHSAGWRIVQVAAARVHHTPRPHARRMLSKRGLRHGVDVARYLLRRSRASARGRPSPR